MPRRLLFPITALALAGLFWLLGQAPDGRTPEHARHPPEEDGGEPSADLASVEPGGRHPARVDSRGIHQAASVTAPATERAQDRGPVTVRLRLMAKGTQHGLSGYSVRLVAAGIRPPHQSQWGRVHPTNHDGYVSIDLEESGLRTEVYAMPLQDGARSLFGHQPQHLRTLDAEELRSGDLHVLGVRTGPSVLYRAALPRGVAATDLIVELESAPSFLSSQMGGLGGLARAVATQEGYALAHIPRITNHVRGDSASLRLWTTDGLWGCETSHDSRVSDGAVVNVDVPLEPRGRFDLLVERIDGPLDDASTLNLAGNLEWSIVGSGAGTDAFAAFRGPSSRTLSPRLLEPGHVRFSALPPGAVIEFDPPVQGGPWLRGYELVEAPGRLIVSREDPPRGVLRVRRP